MISVTCPGCKRGLNANDELAGQTRKCPKCGATIEIPQPAAPDAAMDTITLDEAVTETHVQTVSRPALPPKDYPERLNRQSKYVILDKTNLVATWENNGNGWMLKAGFGFVSAARNHEQIPAQGDFKLVELRLKMMDDGLRMTGMTSYQLAKRWALTKLDKGDDKILGAITGMGFFNRDQKAVIRKHIKEQFMRQVWEDAHNVLDFLQDRDYHSPGVG